MCYAYKTVLGPDGGFMKVAPKEFEKMWQSGKIKLVPGALPGDVEYQYRW